MHGSSASDGRIKWWLSGSAALALHAAVVLALPDSPNRQPSAISDVVTITWTEGGSGLGGAAHGMAEAPHPGPDRTAAASLHASRSRATETSLRRQATARRVPATVREGRAYEELQQSSRSAVAEASALSPSATTPNGAQSGDGSPSGAGEGGSSGAARGNGSVLGAAGQGSVSRAPSLLAAGNPCRGYFPSTARADHGRVQIRVGVDVTGHASDSQILIESPVGQEFGSAARACAAALRFQPAADGIGAPIAGVAKLELRFDRS